MSENETSPEELEAFREEIRNQIDIAIESLLIGEWLDEVVTIDPSILSEEQNGPSVDELDSEKRQVLKEELYKLIGLIEGQTQPITSYETTLLSDPNENLTVSVFEGKSQDPETGEDRVFYLHESYYAKSKSTNWQVATTPEPI